HRSPRDLDKIRFLTARMSIFAVCPAIFGATGNGLAPPLIALASISKPYRIHILSFAHICAITAQSSGQTRLGIRSRVARRQAVAAFGDAIFSRPRAVEKASSE